MWEMTSMDGHIEIRKTRHHWQRRKEERLGRIDRKKEKDRG